MVLIGSSSAATSSRELIILPGRLFLFRIEDLS